MTRYFGRDTLTFHYENYALECISSESDVNLSIDFVHKSLKKSWFHKIKMFLNWSCRKIFTKCFIPDRSLSLAKKVQNIHKVITNTFPPVFFPNLSIEYFTPSFAQQLHRQIGNGLINNAGQYRTRFVMTAQDNLMYLAPDLIENRMNELLRQCREKFERTECFLSYFLLIHPFINGNGKVARLLLNYLLIRFTVVPFSLYIGTKTRDVYLQCLREAQWYQDSFKPSVLASFILECIHMTSYNLCVVMDIEIQDSTIES
ncbi:158_t:CDS:1 [Diversispora eburnea]|uniref:158_t:CDS:1 n=1 Tax=Diversispora eburnea TaxID=1213867 RepID=A0A9N9ALZ1_9GLOM|nr:158_t:CDS:1 [Diversispora eburnea]